MSIVRILALAAVGYMALAVTAFLLRRWHRRRTSPMPAERYDDSRGERSLWNPVRVPLDSALADLARRYAGSDAAGRARMRDSIDVWDSYYELTTFAERAAVFALRERNAEHVRDGLAAIAMIDLARTNAYDTSIDGPVALLHHVATRIGADAPVLLREAGALAEGECAQFLTRFPDRPAEEKDLKVWMREEVQTPRGPGFIQRMFRNYQPTLDLVSAGLEMMDVLARDEYRPGDLTIATDLPSAVWLRTGAGVNHRAISRALTPRACATIDASLRPEVHPRHRAQSLIIFLMELADEQNALTLQDASRQARLPRNVLLGIAEGRLFCLVAGRSTVPFARAYETTERLARFEAPLREVLRRHAAMS
ncbi:MAG TPA: hypothetical protein VHG08_27575 [Longimicrobium sp.]|nr:hypothetical protein [Longimicrobium sp.]